MNNLIGRAQFDKPLDARRTKAMTTAAGLIWMCAAQFFLAQIIVQSQWTTPFSWATNYISDLGNTTCGAAPSVNSSSICSPWHNLMNLSFILQGLIIIVGAIILVQPPFAGRLWRILVCPLLIVTALGIIGVGLFPEDANNRAHLISAGTQFITGNSAMMLFGVALLNSKQWYVLAILSSALGLVGLLATALFAHGEGLGLGVGGMERVAAYTLPIWLITSGVSIVRTRLAQTPFNK